MVYAFMLIDHIYAPSSSPNCVFSSFETDLIGPAVKLMKEGMAENMTLLDSKKVRCC